MSLHVSIESWVAVKLVAFNGRGILLC